MMQFWEIPQETQTALEGIQLEDAAALRAAFWADSAAFRRFAAESPHGLEVLKLYQLVTADTAVWYAARGIPEKILRDSLLDVGIWCRDYLHKHGQPGLAEWEWLALTLRGKLFRLGRLQFEPSRLSHALGEYPADIPVLEVHIPAEAPLDPAAVQESLAQASGFFQQYFGTTYPAFHCHSWLLSPVLGQLLPPESRILQFQSLFTIAAVDLTDRQAEERVFGFCAADPARYPANTALQKAMRQKLCAGEPIGVGHGLRKI